jgi:hemolysin activation/secretion protein
MIRAQISIAGAFVALSAGLSFSSAPTQATAQGLDISSARAQESIRRLEELDRQSQIDQTGPDVLSEPLGRQELPPAGGPTVLLQDVVFAPDSVFLSADELQAIASNYVGQRVDFRQISSLVRDVNDLYAAKGVVTAAAILPPQDLAEGRLEVRLVEGQVGNVSIVGERLTSDEYVLNRIRLSKGSTVDIPTAARDIAYFNATNRANVRLALQPGASFGLTDLTLGLTEPPRDQLQFFLDNTGAESSGEEQVSGVYRRYGLLGRDDTFLAFTALTEGNRSLTLRYDVPVSTSGTRLAATWTGSRTDIIDGPAADLGIEGKSRSLTLGLTQPFIATETWLLEGIASVFRGKSKTNASGIDLVDSETDKFSLGVSGSYTTERTSLAGQLSYVAADTTDNLAATGEDYGFIIGSFRGTYQVNESWRLVANGAFQEADDDLVPGDLLFQVGGPTTVRGYPSDGVAGDDGYFANIEARYRSTLSDLPVEFFAFTDFGRVESTFPRETNLWSAGVGVDWALSNRSSLNLTLAVPIEDAVSNQDDFVVLATFAVNLF